MTNRIPSAKRGALLASLAVMALIMARRARLPARQDPTPQQTISAAEEIKRIRGLERDQKPAANPARALLALTFFVPRQTLDGLLYGAQRGVGVFADPEFIARAEEFFFIVDRKLGWYPRMTLGSGVTPISGAALFYRDGDRSAAIKGGYNAAEKWETEAQVGYQWRRGETSSLSALLSGAINRDDDLQFFGIGSDPGTDERSFFIAGVNADNADYSQRREQVRLSLGMESMEAWQINLTSLYPEEGDLELGRNPGTGVRSG